MSGLRARVAKEFRNAFDLGPKGPSAPTDQEISTIERILAVIVRKRMVGPTVLFLESVRPFNAVSAQAIRFFAPFANVLIDDNALKHLASFLERRGSIDWLCKRLDELDRPPAP